MNDAIDAPELEQGHLTDGTVELLADGATALVGDLAREHASSCQECALRVGDAALRSAALQLSFDGLPASARAAIASPPQSDEKLSQGERRRGGGWAIAVGLLVAAAASVPGLAGAARAAGEVREALEVALAVTLQLEQALRLASGRLEAVRVGSSWVAAAALVAVGLWVARRGPRPVAVQEEAR